jgi:hypothetical protein
MISAFDSADEAIEKLIKEQCQELERTNADDPCFLPLVESITKLRQCKIAPIIESK